VQNKSVDEESKSGAEREVHQRRHSFLEEREVRFFESLCSLIVPEGENPKEDPGALTVGALNYIDSVLSDFPKGVQDYFAMAVKAVDDTSLARFSKGFPDLSDSDKNLVLREMYLNPRTRELMLDLRSLVLGGFYSDYRDPWYNGKTAWEYIHFGGKRISDIKKDWTFLRVWRDWEAAKVSQRS